MTLTLASRLAVAAMAFTAFLSSWHATLAGSGLA